MSKSHHLILVKKESIARFWSIQLLWIRGDYQTQWLDAFQINQVKVLSSSHQVCSSTFKVHLFPHSHEAQRWSRPARSPKQTCCCCRQIRLSSDLHTCSEEQMHSVAIAVISLTTCFLSFISKLVVKIDILNLGLLYSSLSFYELDILFKE